MLHFSTIIIEQYSPIIAHKWQLIKLTNAMEIKILTIITSNGEKNIKFIKMKKLQILTRKN